MGRSHLIPPLGGLLAAMLTLPIAPTAVAASAPAVNVSVVNDAAGGQTDPHASGDWVAYTDSSVNGVRFQNLDLGMASDRVIPHGDGVFDSLSDLSGYTIVFQRVSDGTQRILRVQIDPFGNPGPAEEVSPAAGALRRHPVVGGDTIAYEDRGYGSTDAAQPEIALSNAADVAAPAYRLTDDSVADLWPAVSADGNAVVWVKCASVTDCDVWRAERSAGVWGAPEQVTGAAGNESWPDSNGPVTVYQSNAGGDDNIRWSVKGPNGYVESVLDLPGVQRNPSIAGHFIAFESSAGLGQQFDIGLYDIATSVLYQLTDTTISETLTDVTTGAGDLVRVVWGQAKQVYPYDIDVYALAVIPAATDTTPPVLDIATPADGTAYVLGQSVQADYACSDETGGSGLKSCTGDLADGATLDTSTVGERSFTVTAEDNAGNQATETVHYRVVYDFAGFFDPLENADASGHYVLNKVRAGSAVPVKFSLGGNQGLAIFAAGYPKSEVIACDPTAEVEAIDQTVTAGASSLGYDAVSGQYSYVWKTDKTWRGCRQLVVKLSDGTTHRASFSFGS